MISFDDFHTETMACAEFSGRLTRRGNRGRARIVAIHARHIGHDTDAHRVRRLRTGERERQGAGGGRSGKNIPT
jgi:hypothetical protein